MRRLGIEWNAASAQQRLTPICRRILAAITGLPNVFVGLRPTVSVSFAHDGPGERTWRARSAHRSVICAGRTRRLAGRCRGLTARLPAKPWNRPERRSPRSQSNCRSCSGIGIVLYEMAFGECLTTPKSPSRIPPFPGCSDDQIASASWTARRIEMRGLHPIRFDSASFASERLLLFPDCVRLAHPIGTITANTGYHRHKLVTVDEIDGLALRKSNGIDGERSGTNNEDFHRSGVRRQRGRSRFAGRAPSVAPVGALQPSCTDGRPFHRCRRIPWRRAAEWHTYRRPALRRCRVQRTAATAPCHTPRPCPSRCRGQREQTQPDALVHGMIDPKLDLDWKSRYSYRPLGTTS